MAEHPIDLQHNHFVAIASIAVFLRKNASGYRVPKIHKQTIFLIALFSAMIFSGCAGMNTAFYKTVETNLVAGNYTQAAAQLAKNQSEFGTKSSVLYNLELGLLDHYAGQYDESNQHFFAAEKEMQLLYTKSISQAAVSLLTNDNELPYEGEDFEKVFVNLFLALNYVGMGNLEDALVEARKVDVKLSEYSRRYQGKNVYQKDAFVRYLMGAIYEAEGELNDAYISYVKAYEGYQLYEKQYGTKMPESLADDILRTAYQLDFEDDLEHYEQLFGKTYQPKSLSEGSLFILIYSGQGPIKEEVKISPTIFDRDGMSHTFAMAVPKFKSRELGTRVYQVGLASADGLKRTTAEVGQDVTAIAKKNLQNRLDLIYLKAGGRAVLKFLAVEAAKKKAKKQTSALGGALFGALLDVGYSASEAADVRTWRTLPHQIQVARFRSTPGTYQLIVKNGTRVVGQTTTEIKPNTITFKVFPDVN
ncbi:conserved hypothetical protein [Chloroherpeton thalassium ATCC 35110]|uniref:TPR domain protein n=1 Tax=Chloroherpeton thalassium (strain ATCC 35110 / GB-78) TaxID=517418 RepID=B3QZ19_CHLT3|nr:hypothetical protein [Chloroherpeton thalassium]ACF13712.1 conserved hypothetical protein [Chloroherpeton thalassium ATCC 35110]